ncbi:hypothetical protein FD31_GL000811 [Companilactobacillus nantensis DSM 16982]|uniref:Uncharacterized protein n=2 Tax=Companilactobacillus nantensis TaxID=305793 RepID=A0A0R1WNN9_9LACO|nr:hypothetical protein FD31_GL000811 [Companilactobacillus nantensis DSM 16982]
MTKAGAEVYKESLRNNLNNSLHKGPHSRRSNIKLADDISLKYKGIDGATYVGFKNTTGHYGYLARFLNDGYMAHGGKGSREHTTKYVPGLHFQERTINETKTLILAAEVKKYKEMLGD